REDLNPLDKAEAIVREIETNTGLTGSDIPRILSTAVRRLGAQKRMNAVVELITATVEEQQQGLSALALDEKERAVFGVILDLQLNPASVDANIFPMLSLADDLKSAIREQGLKGVHAIALSKLSVKNLGVSEEEAREIRVKTTQQVISDKLSASQTRKLVGEVVVAQAQPDSTSTAKTKPVSVEARRLQKLSIESLQAADPEQLVEFQEVLRQKLAEIEAVLGQK
ncbi:MAG TPA: chromosome partitioning protein ParB, partial [Cyanobacteria bacterium UBA11368]|nr:chromosome partitioning protein ParB [Cyanobacteria bacterium UBA11368]